MTEDPRRAIVEVMARVGRETQYHLDERERRFRITDGVTLTISVLLVILAVFNVYYVQVLYRDLNGIVSNMDSMYAHLRHVDGDMAVITNHMAAFDRHMVHMEPINGDMAALAGTMPGVRGNMDRITSEMATIEQNMGSVSQGMSVIDDRVRAMTGGVAVMRENMGQIARPMGGMPFMP
jgi:methyl-accepting chemotaxis protein